MDKKKRVALLCKVAFLLFLVCASVAIIAQQRKAPYQLNTGLVFGTGYNIRYQNTSDLSEDISECLARVDASLSMFNDSSTTARVNRGETTSIDTMFRIVFTLSQQVSEQTGGAFDITVAPAVNAWGFGTSAIDTVAESQIDSLRQIVGYDKVKCEYSVRDGWTIVKADPRVKIDFSAIAKGYACDLVAKYLEKKGVTNYMVEIGGEVVVKGVNQKRQPWRIGIAQPSDDSTGKEGKLHSVINIKDKAMATSGNYRNFYYKDGVKYAHTIDPATCSPVQHSLLSATVFAKNCATADAYATAFMVMGVEKAIKLLDSHTELKAYLIYSDEAGSLATWASPALSDILSGEAE